MPQIDGKHMSIEDVVSVARQGQAVELAPESRVLLAESRAWVEDILADEKAVYGINTGFGIFAEKHISAADAQRLNRNLILSHAVGTGPHLSREAVRAAMLIRANTLAGGYSGVRPDLVETLLAMLNQGVTPIVPSQGSLGASGDLAPLSHLALVFTRGEEGDDEDSGYANYNGQTLTGVDAMRAAGIPRLVLGPKEGLAITNGATFSAGLAALAVHDAALLLDVADLTLAMTLEALLGASDAFDPRLHAARRQSGQEAVAARVRQLVEGSTLLDAAGRVHDAYSVRCAPQVHGPARDILTFIQDVIAREVNAVTDNPLVFGPGEAVSGGNFHGETVGLAMDYLKIAMAEVAAIAERRVFHLTDGKMNADLPPMLVDMPEVAGLNSGMMMPQYTAASLVLENQSLASPDSVHSLPTSGGKEDHNANAMTAARNASQLVRNVSHVLAIEAYCAARALDLRLRQNPDAHMGAGVAAAHQVVRSSVPYQPGDAWWGPEIEEVRELVLDGTLTAAVSSRER